MHPGEKDIIVSTQTEGESVNSFLFTVWQIVRWHNKPQIQYLRQSFFLNNVLKGKQSLALDYVDNKYMTSCCQKLSKRHPWAIKTPKHQNLQQSSSVRQKGFKEVRTTTDFKFPAHGEKKKKASWVVGGSSLLFLAYSKERRHVRKIIRSPLRNRTGSHQFSVSESLYTNTLRHTQRYSLFRGPPLSFVVTLFCR